jgi:hypothetical protein
MKGQILTFRGERLSSSPTSRRIRAWVVPLVIAGVLAVGIMAFFLSIYRFKGYVVPIGWDTSKYVWRTALARVLGLTHLQEGVPVGVFGDPSRPGFVVIGSTLASVTRSNLFEAGAILPAISAATIGLAAGAFVSAILRRGQWEFAVTAAAVGTSVFVIRLAGPETYQDNLFAAAVFMAAALAIALALEDPRALIPAALLLGAGGIIHWAFLAFILGTLGLTALAFLPESFRSWRSGDGLWSTPTARLAMAAGGGAVLAGATLYGLLSSGPRPPKLSLLELVKKLRLDTPKYRFPVTLPLAAVGALSLANTSQQDRGRVRARFALVFFLAWCGVALVGYLGLQVFHLAIPGHRFLSFALAVPILAVIGLLALFRLAAARNAPLAGAFLIGVLLVGAVLSLGLWYRTPPSVDPSKIVDGTAAAAYLDARRIGRDRPVIVIVPPSDGSTTALYGHILRATLPSYRIDDMYLYVGTTENYLAHRPTQVPSEPLANQISKIYFDRMAWTYERSPVALVIRSFDRIEFQRWSAAHPDSVVDDGVSVVAGGPVRSIAVPLRQVPIGLGEPKLGFLALGFISILSAIGLGWTVLLLRPWLRPLEMLALSPAVGIAVLVPSGILVDRLGIRLVGAGALSTVLIAGGMGWGLAALAARRRPPYEDEPGRALGAPLSSPSSSP